jgi:hypothetical protein
MSYQPKGYLYFQAEVTKIFQPKGERSLVTGNIVTPPTQQANEEKQSEVGDHQQEAPRAENKKPVVKGIASRYTRR